MRHFTLLSVVLSLIGLGLFIGFLAWLGLIVGFMTFGLDLLLRIFHAGHVRG